MIAWNIVATARPEGFHRAHSFLSRFGPTTGTEFQDVLVTLVRDVDRFPEAFAQSIADQPDIMNAIGRVVPVNKTFSFQVPEEFDQKARAALSDWISFLGGRSFHVRIHRRGFKGRISSLAEEQALNRFILEELERRGQHSRIEFDDPDAILDIEIVGQQAGMALWSKDQRDRYPFLHLD
jgi:tRNA(Ser,Leu) C12 N-acetylase TAN1